MTKLHDTFNPCKQAEPTRKLKPIEFTKIISAKDGDPCLDSASSPPNYWDHVMPIEYVIGHHIFLAWNDGDHRPPCIYIGHLNDGVIEE